MNWEHIMIAIGVFFLGFLLGGELGSIQAKGEMDFVQTKLSACLDREFFLQANR